MKVCLVTSFPRDPGSPHGGVEAVSVQLARSLARFDDLAVDVVTTDRACTAAVRTTWEGATIHRLPWVGKTVLSHACVEGRRAIQETVAHLAPDVVHAHDIYGLMIKGMPMPRVFTIHGFIHADTRLSGQRFALLRSWLWWWVETRGWAEQPHIISISPYVRERLRGTARGVVHDIDNPIAAEFFEVERQEKRRRLFCAGVICRRKNQLVLVDALARLRARGVPAELRLAGPVGDAAYDRLLRERIEALDLTASVHLLGSLSSQQVQEELAAASVFVLPSLEEGSPMGITEAMAVGVPVVTSNRCGMPYMVRDGASGYLIDPTDLNDLVARLEDVLTNDTLRERMGLESRRIACDRFHPDVVAHRTREVYYRVTRNCR